MKQAAHGHAAGLGPESPGPKVLCTGCHTDGEILANHLGSEFTRRVASGMKEISRDLYVMLDQDVDSSADVTS